MRNTSASQCDLGRGRREVMTSHKAPWGRDEAKTTNIGTRPSRQGRTTRRKQTLISSKTWFVGIVAAVLVAFGAFGLSSSTRTAQADPLGISGASSLVSGVAGTYTVDFYLGDDTGGDDSFA